MEKYLFTDGTNGVREVQSQEELRTLIGSAAHPDKIRIWTFNSHEWISYAEFSKRSVPPLKKNTSDTLVIGNESRPSTGRRWLKKFLLFILAGAAIFLVYNFTRIRWEKVAPLSIIAERPANVPLMNADSVIQEIENTRGQKLDKITKTNLRIRDTWPDRIILQLNAGRDSSSAGLRFHDIELSIDNTTGYYLDNAVVKLTTWKNNESSSVDTIRFSNISYAMPAKRKLSGMYKADSLSISFSSVKAKVFNFCYSADKKSNYGNNTDKWFCRE